ncbi:SM-ATX domain-containing protein [Trichostrongylus colubriformis]|uniref:SM-ATX domain-containing protein n=1 Tax=Trichostrongylus colubriformis TaxID=6319 RepID=A0AAN8IJB8_TRICO
MDQNFCSLQSQVDGIYANHALLTIINDLVGKEVLVEAVDGAKYSGIFTACSPEFDIGLRHAYKITTGNMTNLLPKKEDMTTKMLFKFSDIVAMSALMNEEKMIRGLCHFLFSHLFRFFFLIELLHFLKLFGINHEVSSSLKQCFYVLKECCNFLM